MIEVFTIVVTLQRRLRILNTQCARFGSHAPSHLVLEQQDVTRQLEQARERLYRLYPQAQLDPPPEDLAQEPPAITTSIVILPEPRTKN